jgi:hypothetical protein
MHDTTNTPVLDAAPREQSLWPVVFVILVPAAFAALLVAAMLSAAHGRGSRTEKLHTYRVVHTRFGDAIVGCGGDVTAKCDEHVGLKFSEETDGLLAYFSAGPSGAHVLDQAYFDHLARGIAGAPPPGTQWTVFECPGARWDVVLFGS